jgi:peptidoglycan/xylan/chitin deacetylase (PgdA/CDA1 family)
LISLDFELHWGFRDLEGAQGPQRKRFLGTRQAIPEILKLFKAFDVSATWAIVGFLFANSKQQLESFSPTVRPAYRDSNLSPYQEPVGEGERDDPVHYAPSLIEAIRKTPGQEIATHTFSHYYCLEPGQTHAAFKADLESAVAIARRSGITLQSLVFPRNQFNPAYEDVLVEAGIACYRGSQRAWMYRPMERSREVKVGRRLTALADAYVNLTGHNTAEWSELVPHAGLSTIPVGSCLRRFNPHRALFDGLRLHRIIESMRAAAIRRQVFHLWGHPEDFGTYTEAGLRFLTEILVAFAQFHDQYGMLSLGMAEAAALGFERHAA